MKRKSEIKQAVYSLELLGRMFTGFSGMTGSRREVYAESD